MKADLVINTNILQAVQSLQSEDIVFYSPIVKSKPQMNFFKKRFQELKEHQQNIEFKPIDDIRNLPSSKSYSTWDSEYESRLHKRSQKALLLLRK